MKPWRIAVGAVLILLVGGIGFVFRLDRSRVAPVDRRTPTTPVMDLGDEPTRNTAYWLMASTSNHFNGEWLGRSCRNESTADRFVLSREDPGPFTLRRAYLRMDDRGGTAFYDAQPMSPNPEPRFGKAWSLSAGQVERFRELLLKGGYYSMRPSGEQGFCHTEVTTLESCIAGRYYGVMRMCETASLHPAMPLRHLADEIERLLDEISQGATRRQAEAAGHAAQPVRPPRGL